MQYIKKKQPKQTEIICKKFGCGKRLYDYEALFSEYCIEHQRQNRKYESKKQEKR